MPELKYRTKDGSNPNPKPRVYFTCHPADFDRCFDKICGDIFCTHDCAIYYTEDMTQPFPQEEQDALLGSNNLFVVPVTSLSTLAQIYGKAGDLKVEAFLENRVYTLRKERLGERHKAALGSLDRLAGIWEKAGQTEKAAQARKYLAEA